MGKNGDRYHSYGMQATFLIKQMYSKQSVAIVEWVVHLLPRLQTKPN